MKIEIKSESVTVAIEGDNIPDGIVEKIVVALKPVGYQPFIPWQQPVGDWWSNPHVTWKTYSDTGEVTNVNTQHN